MALVLGFAGCKSEESSSSAPGTDVDGAAGEGSGAATGSGGSGGTGGVPGPGEGGGGSSSIPHEKDYSIEYYRLRVEYLDQSDWTTLAVDDPSKVIKVRLLEQSGTPNVLTIDKEQLGLNTNFGSDLSVTVDYALTTDVLSAPFEFHLTKGAAGKVTVRISTVVSEQVTLIKEIVDQSEPLDFSVDLSPLEGVDPWKAPLAPVERKGIALYYPWYSLDSWSSEDLMDKPTTPYASNNPEDLARQMDQAKSAGITGFITSWTGPGSSSDDNVALLLETAAQKDFSIGFFLETTIGGITNNPENIAAWLSYIDDTYGDDPALMQVDGRAVVVPWLTCDTTAENWATARQSLRDAGKDVWLVQDCQDMAYLETFDGVWYDGGIGGLGEKVRYHSVLADAPAPKLWIPTAMPGFDEHLLDDRINPRVYPRENGDVLKTALSTAIGNSAQWVALYTWNEWFENTHIEPSEAYGDQYLRITGDYLSPWLE